MPMSQRSLLKGSERRPLAGARVVGPTDPTQLVEVSIILKPQRELSAHALQGRTLTREEFASQYGATQDAVNRIRQFAKENNLQVLDQGDETVRRTVVVAGTAAAMQNAFGIQLNDYEHDEGTYRGREGAIQIPTEYADIIQGVLGLDDRPTAKPHFRMRSNVPRQGFGARASNTSYTPLEVAKLYSFPQGVTGAGQTIAILELGGGYRPADLRQYFTSLGLKMPKIKSVSVDHGKNRPSTPDSADGEVMLDIEVAGAVAPGANIVVYFAPNTTRGFQDALSKAIHDTVNKPSAISISWGSAEVNWTQQSMQAFDQVAQEAAALGITITAASGDNGSSDAVTDGGNHVDFPASSPHILATGGTRLDSLNGKITSETVWNDGPNSGATGGGYSSVFSRPSYQDKVSNQSGRGVPDVSGNADPETGYQVLVDGQNSVIGGTSAVAPLWAGLVALLNEKLKTRVGYLNPTLYALKQNNAMRDITQGNNGAYAAASGWDPTTGLGTPVGDALATVLASMHTQEEVGATPTRKAS